MAGSVKQVKESPRKVSGPRLEVRNATFLNLGDSNVAFLNFPPVEPRQQRRRANVGSGRCGAMPIARPNSLRRAGTRSGRLDSGAVAAPSRLSAADAGEDP